MNRRRAMVTLAIAGLCGWALPAAALDRVGAIEVAKREAGPRCSADAACTFTAKVEEGKWHVRVDFPRDKTPQKAKLSGHTIYIINQTGKIVGRVESK
jgi:hypothetical protein